MERADQVLAVRRIDAGLAADRGIDLRQQRGRHLHEIDAAPHDRRGKAGEIADHAAAERDHEIVALDARRDQRLADLLEDRHSSSSPRPPARSRGSTRCRPRASDASAGQRDACAPRSRR